MVNINDFFEYRYRRVQDLDVIAKKLITFGDGEDKGIELLAACVGVAIVGKAAEMASFFGLSASYERVTRLGTSFLNYIPLMGEIDNTDDRTESVREVVDFALAHEFARENAGRIELTEQGREIYAIAMQIEALRT